MSHSINRGHKHSSRVPNHCTQKSQTGTHEGKQSRQSQRSATPHHHRKLCPLVGSVKSPHTSRHQVRPAVRVDTPSFTSGAQCRTRYAATHRPAHPTNQSVGRSRLTHKTQRAKIRDNERAPRLTLRRKYWTPLLLSPPVSSITPRYRLAENRHVARPTRVVHHRDELT